MTAIKRKSIDAKIKQEKQKPYFVYNLNVNVPLEFNVTAAINFLYGTEDVSCNVQLTIFIAIVGYKFSWNMNAIYFTEIK